MPAVKPSIERKVCTNPSDPFKALGIGSEEFYKLAQNIGRMRLLLPEQRQGILERAYEELPEDILSRADGLIMDLFNDKEVYEIAGIPYHKGSPEGQKNFRAAIFDYLLRTRVFE